MAETHSIAGRINAAGAERLTAALARAFADGADLGPRAAQIRALGLSLDTLAEALRIELARFEVALVDAGVRSSGHPKTQALLAEIERIATLASAYRGSNTANAADAAGDTTL